MKKICVFTLIALLYFAGESPNSVQAATICMDFSVSDFQPIDDSYPSSPQQTITGSLVWEGSSVNAEIDYFIEIDMMIDGHSYEISELAFADWGYCYAIGGIINYSVNGIATGTNDFWIKWDSLTLEPFESFAFTSALTVGGAWTSNNFEEFSIVNLNTVPIPGAIWLLGSGLIGLAGFRRKFGK